MSIFLKYIILIIPLIWICCQFGSEMFWFLVNPKVFLTNILPKEIFIGIAGLVTLALAIWKSWINHQQMKSAEKTVENQTKTILNEEFTKKNQQFLDAIALFKEENLEIKKGGLFHLENLALSSPEHRQRVLDFLNSLNQWMRDHQEELKDEDFYKWKTQKKLLLPEEIVPKNTQLLSAEIPKIFENIIKYHNKQWESFSEAEKEKYKLDFSYFIFPRIDFTNEIFPQEETKFVGVLVLECIIFNKVIFEGVIDFSDSTFEGNVGFSEVEFKKGSYFNNIIFEGETDFQNSTFLEITIFSRSKFNGITHFNNNIFFNYVSFSGSIFKALNDQRLNGFKGFVSFNHSKFLKEVNFERTLFENEADFSNIIFAESSKFMGSTFSEIIADNTNFTKLGISKYPVLFNLLHKEQDFISLENFEKFSAAGAFFSDEQKKFFTEKKILKELNN